MSYNDPEQKMFLCPEHHFVVIATRRGEVSSRGTPTHRVTGCPTCDQAVNEAFDYAGMP